MSQLITKPKEITGELASRLFRLFLEEELTECIVIFFDKDNHATAVCGTPRIIPRPANVLSIDRDPADILEDVARDLRAGRLPCLFHQRLNGHTFKEEDPI